MKKILLIILGIIAGIINGMFSTGAGLVLVPAFMYLFKMDAYLSRGTSILVIFVFCIINLIIYWNTFYFDMSIIPIIIGSIVGTILGMKLVYKINKSVLSIMFAVFTIIMGIGMIK